MFQIPAPEKVEQNSRIIGQWAPVNLFDKIKDSPDPHSHPSFFAAKKREKFPDWVL